MSLVTYNIVLIVAGRLFTSYRLYRTFDDFYWLILTRSFGGADRVSIYQVIKLSSYRVIELSSGHCIYQLFRWQLELRTAASNS